MIIKKLIVIYMYYWYIIDLNLLLVLKILNNLIIFLFKNDFLFNLYNGKFMKSGF